MAEKKEYAVFVKEALLDPKHYRILQKRNSIFLYLWLLQKVTHVDKKTGLGIVLGGKPFKCKDFEMVSRLTCQRMFEVLEQHGYIKTTRTPYGHVVWVTKCVKYFGREISQFAGFSKQMPMDFDESKKIVMDVPKEHITMFPDGTSLDQNGTSNKTIQLDNTVTTKSLVEDSKTEPKYDDDDMRLTDILLTEVRTNYPFIKPPSEAKLCKDHEEMNRLHRIDGYGYDVIEAVIFWSQQDNFWKQNIRSVGKLRKQFDTLLIKAKTHAQRGVIIR